MYEKTIQFLSSPTYHPAIFDVNNTLDSNETSHAVIISRDFMDKEYYPKWNFFYESLFIEYIIPALKQWDNVDFFEKKFDELKEKEMKNTLTEFEENFLYQVIEKRLLEFPNPFLPRDHKELMATKNEYRTVVNKFERNCKSR